MDLRQLRHFLAAARLGNLTEAARELGVSQPALSKTIRALEARLGVTLLERGRFGVRPTQFGEAVLVHGRAMQAELHSLESQIAALRRGDAGVVRIGCGPSEATSLLPLALNALTKTRGDLRFDVLYGLNDSLMPAVRRGEIEFAVSWAPNFSPDADLLHEPLYTDTACVVARAGHPLAHGNVVGAAELAACQWILSRSQSIDRRSFENLFLSQGVAPPKVTVETTSTILMKSLVACSDFLTFIPRDLMYWEARHSILVELPARGPAWSGSVGITRRKRARLSPAASALLDALKEVAKEQLPRLAQRGPPGLATAERTARGIVADAPKSAVESRHMKFELDQHPFFWLTQIIGARDRELVHGLRTFGLRVPEWRILAALYARQRCTMSELADLATIDRTTLTRTIDRMEGAGWLSRLNDPSDMRVTRLALTAQGRRLFERVWPAVETLNGVALAGVGKAEVQQLRDILGRMRTNLDMYISEGEGDAS